MNERRRERRMTEAQLRTVDARVRPGHRVRVIDLSPCGALIEGERPLPPGSNVVFQLQGRRARVAVSARVVRCTVTALTAETGVTYRAGLAFEEGSGLLREATAQDEYGLLGPSSIGDDDGDKLPGARGERDAIGTHG